MEKFYIAEESSKLRDDYLNHLGSEEKVRKLVVKFFETHGITAEEYYVLLSKFQEGELMDNKELWKETLDLEAPLTIKEKQLEIITHYGDNHQLDKLIEECSELIQAVCKWKQNYKTDDAIDYLTDLLAEIADVENIIDQYKLMDNYINQEVENWKEIK